MIKKIIFDFPNASVLIYRIQFYTKINGELTIYDIGKYIGVAGYGIKFDKIDVTCDKFSGTALHIRNPFEYNGNYTTFSNGTGRMTITFKEGLKVLYGIYHGFVSTLPTKISIYDENDVLLHEGTEFEKMPASGSQNATQFYATPDLELIKVYPTDVIGTIETNDNTQISNIHEIENIIISQSTPENTDIKYLLSFDGRNTYKTYKDSSWSDVDISNKENIMSFGLSKDELESLTENDFSAAINDNKTMDMLIGMSTQNESVSPSISEVKVLYLRIV